MDRREFLQILGLVSGATLLSSCGSDTGQKELISYLVPVEEGIIPGVGIWRPSTCTECPAHCGIQARLREGRPVKLEGIPEHPVSRGGLCMRGQASLWRLYHPERIRTPLQKNAEGRLEPISWSQALERIVSALRNGQDQGRHNYFLSGRTTGSLADLIEQSCPALLLERLPEFEPFSHAGIRQGYQVLFDRKDVPYFRIEQADLLVTVGADILETFISPVDFAAQLTLARERDNFRWIHLEPHLSLTGANASLRLSAKPGAEPHLLSWLLQTLAADNRFGKRWPAALNGILPEQTTEATAAATGLSAAQLEDLVNSIVRAEKPLLIVGGVATAHGGGNATALLGALIQWLISSPWGGIDFTSAANFASVGSLLDIKDLINHLAADEVGVFMVTRCNPVFHTPRGLDLPQAFEKAQLRVGFADIPDETTALMDLVLPLSHSLETWGDIEPRKGVHSLLQPMLTPLDQTLPEGEILLRLRGQLNGQPAADWQAYLKNRWQREFDRNQLQQLLEKGYFSTEAKERTTAMEPARTAEILRQLQWPAPLPKPVAVLTHSIRTFDGRSRPLPLLHEVPDPLTTISYGNWVSVGPETAVRYDLKDSLELQLNSAAGEIIRPVQVQPGLPAEVLTLPLDSVSPSAVAFDPQSGEAIRYLDSLQLRRTGTLRPLPILSGSFSQHGRGIIPRPIHRKKEESHKRYSLYPEPSYEEYRWTMVIDLKRCIGCGACAAACYMENNVPLVGPEEHLKGREMSWLRIEPFYDEDGRVEFIPMLCQHCTFAPCEPVCPVYAAYHNPEGLNIQVYSRCVGTRYCSNNCPYKVRRFNWWDPKWPAPANRMLNPDVTMRSKGMMEKCTFCIQRLRAALDHAKDEKRPVRDGEATPACAQSCPTSAIVFGNMLDKNSRVNSLIGDQRAYRVFSQLGTEPAVYYLRPGQGTKPEPTKI
ncbi:MAG: 4Fe-4S dicluster domain-containing protein [Syntrophotaleaceae bacterium]